MFNSPVDKCMVTLVKKKERRQITNISNEKTDNRYFKILSRHYE